MWQTLIWPPLLVVIYSPLLKAFSVNYYVVWIDFVHVPDIINVKKHSQTKSTGTAYFLIFRIPRFSQVSPQVSWFQSFPGFTTGFYSSYVQVIYRFHHRFLNSNNFQVIPRFHHGLPVPFVNTLSTGITPPYLQVSYHLIYRYHSTFWIPVKNLVYYIKHNTRLYLYYSL